jgi:hypothetical protein
MRSFVLGLAGALALAAAAGAAQPPSAAWLTLKTKTSRDHLMQDGNLWQCKMTVCKAAKVRTGDPAAACKTLAGQLGELTAFSWQGAVLGAEDLAACNAAAKS